MISVADAEAIIGAALHFLEPEWVNLTEATGRILAEGVASPSDFPAAPTSSMDGYAVRAADLPQGSVDLAIVETIPAGALPSCTVEPGEAARLFTGSILPEGSDTVVMQERTERLNDQTVRVLDPVKPGQFVRQVGQFCRQGDPLLTAGMKLGAPEIAVLAAIQRSWIPVFQRPRVAILSTGNELARLDQPLSPGQIVDSNSFGLAALVRTHGGIPIQLGIVRDDPGQTRAAITQALQVADVVISSGGVSVGEFDYVETMLEALGGELRIRSVAIKPGKPLTFAVFPDHRLYFGLPGNPVSALVTFWRFVAPALARMQGQTQGVGPQFWPVLAAADLLGDRQRESYLWGQVRWQQSQPTFHPIASHHSGDLMNLAGCNGLAKLLPGQERVPTGDPVPVLLI